jgi:hypothetical protein
MRGVSYALFVVAMFLGGTKQKWGFQLVGNRGFHDSLQPIVWFRCFFLAAVGEVMLKARMLSALS